MSRVCLLIVTQLKQSRTVTVWRPWLNAIRCLCWIVLTDRSACTQTETRQHMRWFTHRRSRARKDYSRQNRMQAAVNMHCRYAVTPGGHTMESSAAACSVQPTAYSSPYHALSLGMTQHFFVFLSLVTLIFDLHIRTRARFLYSAPNRQVSLSYVESFGSYPANKQTNWQTNKHTPLKTSTSLCYAMPLGNERWPESAVF